VHNQETFLGKGVQGAQSPAGVRGVPEKPFFPVFAATGGEHQERKKSGGYPRTPRQGLATPVNPA